MVNPLILSPLMFTPSPLLFDQMLLTETTSPSSDACKPFGSIVVKPIVTDAWKVVPFETLTLEPILTAFLDAVQCVPSSSLDRRESLNLRSVN